MSAILFGLFFFTYIMAVSFIGGGNRNTRKKTPTYRKSLTNWISDSYLRKNRSKILQKHMAIYYVMGYFLVNPEKCDYCLLLKKSMLL
jgi:hypothetical protein